MRNPSSHDTDVRPRLNRHHRSGTLHSAKASIRITKKLGKGTHSIKAYYSGSEQARTSTSGTTKPRVK